jgi:RNA polymerase sigma factor (sigma-70 family)
MRHELSAAGGLSIALPVPTLGGRRRRGDAVKRPSATGADGPGQIGTAGLADRDGHTAPTAAWQRGQDFIQRCIAGEPGTRDEFVVEYSGLIRFAIAAVLRHRGITLLREEIDDLTHNVIVSLFDRDCRKLKMYEGRNQASFATFVRVCATRLTLDHLRSLQRRPQIAAGQQSGDDVRDVLAETADAALGPEEHAAVAEDLATLRRLVADLSPREQLLVRLHFVEGLDIPDVARALGVSENAAHVLKSRLRAKLRGQMRAEAGEHA